MCVCVCVLYGPDVIKSLSLSIGARPFSSSCLAPSKCRAASDCFDSYTRVQHLTHTHSTARSNISTPYLSLSLGLSSSRLGFKRIHLYDIVVVLGPRAAAPAARIDRLHKQSSNPMKLYTVPCCCCCCFPSRF